MFDTVVYSSFALRLNLCGGFMCFVLLCSRDVSSYRLRVPLRLHKISKVTSDGKHFNMEISLLATVWQIKAVVWFVLVITKYVSTVVMSLHLYPV